MSCFIAKKDPLDKRRVRLDFGSQWLGTSQIASVSWTVPTGITESGSSFDVSTGVAQNFFQGGTEGQEYEVACAITTDDSPTRTKTQRVLIQVENCC